jgi:hypothetical protein
MCDLGMFVLNISVTVNCRKQVYDHVVQALIHETATAIIGMVSGVNEISEDEAHSAHRVFKKLQEVVQFYTLATCG